MHLDIDIYFCTCIYWLMSLNYIVSYKFGLTYILHEVYVTIWNCKWKGQTFSFLMNPATLEWKALNLFSIKHFVSTTEMFLLLQVLVQQLSCLVKFLQLFILGSASCPPLPPVESSAGLVQSIAILHLSTKMTRSLPDSCENSSKAYTPRRCLASPVRLLALIDYCGPSVGGSPAWNRKYQTCLMSNMFDIYLSGWLGFADQIRIW